MNIPLKIIDDFVENSFTFRNSVPLKTLERQEYPLNQIALAASARDLTHAEFQRIGALSNSEQTILVRIFHSRKSHQYRLYFLDESGQSFENSIVTSQNTFKYFIIDQNQHTVIPEKVGIDPLNDQLMINVPDAAVTISARSWRSTGQEAIAGDADYLFQIQYEKVEQPVDRQSKEKIYCAITSDSDEPIPTKLLFQQGNITRLVPVREGAATILIPQISDETIHLSLYK